MASVILYGDITKKLFHIWNERAKSATKLHSTMVAQTLQDMDLYPSSSQVHEMTQCANECSKRQYGNHITFGEFCVFATELKSRYEHKIPKPAPLSQSTKERKLSSVSSTSSTKSEVFLGGSCNPTTWRKDLAIPTLKTAGITYYNPQVNEWSPELIEIERLAKQNAEVMFFVIDNQTRAIASMIEASYIAGTQKKLILILKKFEKPGAIVMGEKISEKEFFDLQQGHHYLQDIVERQGIPVFNQVPKALECMAIILKKNMKPQDLIFEDATYKVKMAYLSIGDTLIKLRKVFDALDYKKSGKISLNDVCIAFKRLTSNELPIESLKSIVSNQTGVALKSDATLDSMKLDKIYVDFNQFCCIITEFRNQTKNEGSPECRDIYLGGSLKSTTWREDIAIPLLKEKGVTYHVPQGGAWSERLIPLESSKLENSQVLLFVITKDLRSLAQMILAAHYVGLNCQVVLCIQNIERDVEIKGEKLSAQAIKDYNRGRAYLSDFATQAGVPVFDDIKEAVNCAINMRAL